MSEFDLQQLLVEIRKIRAEYPLNIKRLVEIVEIAKAYESKLGKPNLRLVV